MNNQKNLSRLVWVLVVALGASLFVYGGYDDSPGAQLLGFIIVSLGIVRIFKLRYEKENKK